MKSASALLIGVLCTVNLAFAQGNTYPLDLESLSTDDQATAQKANYIFERYNGTPAMQDAIEEHLGTWRRIELDAVTAFPWPRRMTFRFMRDNSRNAFYNPRGANGLPEIRVDYAYIEKVAQVYRDKGVNLKEWGMTPEQLACCKIDSTLAHELGHAVHYEFGLPAVGRHEDVADQFGLLLLRSQQTGMLAAAASIKYYLLNKGGSVEDTHALDEQRAYEALSMLHGFAPNEFTFVKKLIGERADRTDGDSENLRRAWNRLLQPVLKQNEFFVGKGAWGGNKLLITNYLDTPVQLQVKNVAFDFSTGRLNLTIPPCSREYYPAGFSALGVSYVSAGPVAGREVKVEGINIEKVAEKGNGWLNTVYKTETTPDNEFQVQVYEQNKPAKDRLYAGNSLQQTATLESPSGRYRLMCGPRGLSIRDGNAKDVWVLNTPSPGTLFLDRVGRLHLESNSYDPNNVSENPDMWEIPAAEKIGQFYLAMQDDGNLVLYCRGLAGESVVWSSSSNRNQVSLASVDSQNTVSQALTTPSGLQYEILRQGQGLVAQTGRTCVVHYTGWLTNGNKFDSSLDRDKPFEFPLGNGRVIKGWDEGVTGMKVGEKRKLVIPPDLGYGQRGAGGGAIPPGATLIFEIDLLEVR